MPKVVGNTNLQIGLFPVLVKRWLQPRYPVQEEKTSTSTGILAMANYYGAFDIQQLYNLRGRNHNKQLTGRNDARRVQILACGFSIPISGRMPSSGSIT